MPGRDSRRPSCSSPSHLVGGYHTWLAAGDDGAANFAVMPGVEYERVRIAGSVAHVASIDLANDCVVLSTPPVEPDGTAIASTTLRWAGIGGMALAVNRLWLLVVDGRQRFYSDGITLAATAGFLASLGATEAVELDGGGSSAMIIDDGDGPRVQSRPIQQRVPGRSRVVANHLGIAPASDPSCLPGERR